MDLPSFETFLLELRSNGVLVVTFDRPEVMNAVNRQVMDGTLEILRFAARDERVRVVVFTGAGRAFSVGGDIEQLEKGSRDATISADSCVRHYVEVMRTMMDMEKPILSAINGYAIGYGLGVALMADISFMAATARLMCGQLRINALPAEAPFLWPLLCGMAKAKYYVFTSEFVDAAEAERIGLVSRVVPAAELMEKTMATADLLASRGRVALGWTKRAMNHWMRIGAPILDTALAFEALNFLMPEAQEGLESMRKTIS